MARPVRIQLSRKRGWRKPDNTISVTRPGKWGNPFVLRGDVLPRRWYISTRDTDGTMRRITVATQDRDQAAREAVLMFEANLRHGYLAITVEDVRRELRGKNLACFCALDAPCHADVLLEAANV